LGALVPLLSRWVGGTELKNLPNSRIVANVAVGYNNVDVVAAEMRGVMVTNTPGVLTEATADLTWALIPRDGAPHRRGRRSRAERQMDWLAAGPTARLELRGRTLGLLGAGRIGQAWTARPSLRFAQSCTRRALQGFEFEERDGRSAGRHGPLARRQ